jgi:hypothetical protein
VSVGIVEPDATVTARAVAHRPELLVEGICGEEQTATQDPGQRGVERLVVQAEGIVLRLDLRGIAVGVGEGDAVVEPDRQEPIVLGSDGDVEDACEELRGETLVRRPDDGVVEVGPIVLPP